MIVGVFALQYLNPDYTPITCPPMLKGEAVLTHSWKSPASVCVPPTKSSAHNGLPVAMGDTGRKSGESTVCTSEALDSGEVSEDVARTSVKRVVLATTLVRCKTGRSAWLPCSSSHTEGELVLSTDVGVALMVTEPACQGKEEVSVQISMEAAKYTGGKGGVFPSTLISTLSERSGSLQKY